MSSTVLQHDMVQDYKGTIRHRLSVQYPAFDGTQNCADVDTSVFYEETNPNIPREVCGGCPFIVECAEWGIAHEEYGVFGGLTPRQRRRVRERRHQQLVRIDPGYWLHPVILQRKNRERAADNATSI